MSLHALVVVLLVLCLSSGFQGAVSKSELQTCMSDEIDTKPLFLFFNDTARKNFKESTSVLTYRPSQSLQGFGNLIIGTFGMMLLAHVKGDIPLVAHAMVAAMFNHPLSNEGLTFQKILEDPDGTISLPSVSDSGPETFRENGPNKKTYINVLGTGDSLKRDPVRQFYADLLNMSTSDPRLYDVMSSAAAQWMLNNPSRRFQSIYEEFKAEKESQCTSGHFDFGIQLRSWVDWLSYYDAFKKNKPCIVDCIESVIVNVVTSAARENDVPPCVFFTADSGEDANDIINSLKRKFSVRSPAVEVEFVVSARPTLIKGEIDDREAYKLHGENDKPFAWRSDFVLRSTRDSFNINDLSKRTDLLDWMLFGDVDTGIYSGGSTFGRTARMRRGYFAQLNDHIFTTRAALTQKGCMCVPVQPEDFSNIKYNGLGVMVL